MLKKLLSMAGALRALAAVSILALACAVAWGQAQPPAMYQPQLITYSGAPPAGAGNCGVDQLALNVSNGAFYVCNPSSHTWVLAASALLSNGTPFTVLQTFNAGISSAGPNTLNGGGATAGAWTHSGLHTFSAGITGTGSIGSLTAPYANLTAFPSTCGANLFATQIAATPGCTQPAFSNLSGIATPTQGGTGSNLSATGGTGQYVKQSSVGGNLGVGTIPAADLPATTSNCAGQNFAQGLNAGGTPICGAAQVPVAQVSAATNFGTNLSTQTVVASMPVTGVVHLTNPLVVNLAGSGCSANNNNTTSTWSFTAPGGTVTTVSGGSISFTGNGTLDGGANPGTAGVQSVVAKAGTAITYTTTSTLGSTGCSPIPQYTVYAKAYF